MRVVDRNIPVGAIYNLAQFDWDLSKALAYCGRYKLYTSPGKPVLPNQLHFSGKISDILQLLQKCPQYPTYRDKIKHNKYSAIA